MTTRYDVVLKRTTLDEMWRPGQPMAQSYESAPNQWMGLSFFVLDRDHNTTCTTCPLVCNAERAELLTAYHS